MRIFGSFFLPVVPDDTCKRLRWIGLQLLLTVWGVKEKGNDSFFWVFYHTPLWLSLLRWLSGHVCSDVVSVGQEDTWLLVAETRGWLRSHIEDWSITPTSAWIGAVHWYRFRLHVTASKETSMALLLYMRSQTLMCPGQTMNWVDGEWILSFLSRWTESEGGWDGLTATSWTWS